jgi:nucleoside-diphosphate-sugar epimerase
MKIVITGGSGFIGRRVISQLVANDAVTELLVLSRATPREQQLDGVRPQVRWITVDLTNAQAVADAIMASRPDVCLHLAWYAEPSKYLTSPENLVMLQVSLQLMRAAAAAGCRRFVAAGTCAEYALQSAALEEDDPAAPSTLYGACKLAVRHVGEALAMQHGMTFAWGRIFYLFGPGEDRRRVIPAVVNTLLEGKQFSATSGEQVRDFLHVDDVASAFVTMCLRDAAGVYNIASGEPVTMRQLLELTAEIVGRPDGIVFGARAKNLFDPPSVVGNASRLRAIGWTPAHSLRHGLEDTVAWWRNEVQGIRSMAS